MVRPGACCSSAEEEPAAASAVVPEGVEATATAPRVVAAIALEVELGVAVAQGNTAVDGVRSGQWVEDYVFCSALRPFPSAD